MFYLAGSTVKLTQRAMWMTVEGPTVSPLCFIKQGGFLCTSPQIMAPPSVEVEPGFQV